MGRFTAVLFILLSGCGGGCCDETADNHGYGWQYDAVGPAGLKLRQANSMPNDAAALEQRARNVFACVAGKADNETPVPPFVIFVPAGSLPGGHTGWFYANPPLILMQSADLMEHETMHYVLDRRGDLDPEHRSPLWKTCFIPPDVQAAH